MATDLRISARDDYQLAATRFDAAGAPQAVVLIASATGVKRSVYRRFAEHLAGTGFAVLTWDYRGIGGSRPATLRGAAFTMRDWAEQDLSGAIEWAAAAWPGVPLVAIGHSFGGQGIGLAPNAGQLTAIVTVAAQSGYWGHWPMPARYLYATLWHVVMPGLTRLVGWFPSRAVGMGEDLPRGVALQWSHWCRSPDYMGDWAGHRTLAVPMLVWGFTDDPYAPPRAVAALHDHYAGATQTRRIMTPAEAGGPVGHFGFFRPGARTLWDETARWLARAIVRSDR